MRVRIKVDVLAPVEWDGVVERKYDAPHAFPDEYVVRLTDGRWVALRTDEFYPAEYAHPESECRACEAGEPSNHNLEPYGG